MSASFVITPSMLYREFSDTESSAIASLAVLFNGVNITYRSNTEKQYIFKGSDRFVAHIRAILTNWNPDEISIGSVIAKARKSGDLKNTEL
jgi:predicted Zn-dependent protease with MMP-like domain